MFCISYFCISYFLLLYFVFLSFFSSFFSSSAAAAVSILVHHNVKICCHVPEKYHEKYSEEDRGVARGGVGGAGWGTARGECPGWGSRTDARGENPSSCQLYYSGGGRALLHQLRENWTKWRCAHVPLKLVLGNWNLVLKKCEWNYLRNTSGKIWEK